MERLRIAVLYTGTVYVSLGVPIESKNMVICLVLLWFIAIYCKCASDLISFHYWIYYDIQIFNARTLGNFSLIIF